MPQSFSMGQKVVFYLEEKMATFLVLKVFFFFNLIFSFSGFLYAIYVNIRPLIVNHCLVVLSRLCLSNPSRFPAARF